MIGAAPYRHMAARFGVSTGALVRHHDDHLQAAVVKASRIGEITRADDLVDRIIVLARETQAVLDRAKAAEDDELALEGDRAGREAARAAGQADRRDQGGRRPSTSR